MEPRRACLNLISALAQDRFGPERSGSARQETFAATTFGSRLIGPEWIPWRILGSGKADEPAPPGRQGYRLRPAASNPRRRGATDWSALAGGASGRRMARAWPAPGTRLDRGSTAVGSWLSGG